MRGRVAPPTGWWLLQNPAYLRLTSYMEGDALALCATALSLRLTNYFNLGD